MSPKFSKTKIIIKYKEFLRYNWLRPENALIDAYRSRELAHHLTKIKSNILDVSCGDGSFFFISSGGKFGPSTNIYGSLELNKSIKDSSTDFFDKFNKSFKVEWTKAPKYHNLVGTDWKLNLLKKAKSIGIYSQLINCDNNYDLPLNNTLFDLVYSNSLHWVKNYQKHVKNLIDNTNDNGILIFNVIEKKNYQSSFNQNLSPYFDKKGLTLLDSGRKKSWKGLFGINEFDKYLLSQNNTNLIKKIPCYGGLITTIWNIGMRPFFSPLVKLVRNSSNKNRKIFQEEWISIFENIGKSIINNYDIELDNPLEWIYVLKKIK